MLLSAFSSVRSATFSPREAAGAENKPCPFSFVFSSEALVIPRNELTRNLLLFNYEQWQIPSHRHANRRNDNFLALRTLK